MRVGSAFALMLLALAGAAAAAPERSAPITIGTTVALPYAPGDERQINVYLPDGYATSGKTYPVLYLIDGGLSQDFLHIAGTSQLGAIWGRSQPVIIVGIETKDRRAELIGSPGNADQRKTYPTAGHSATFRAFIRDKVKPYVAAHYRVSGVDGVIGESLAGLFIVETWLREPALFGSYAAISPSIWWDDGALSKQASRLIGARQAGHRLFVATEDEGPEYQAHFDRLTGALAGIRTSPSGQASGQASERCVSMRPDVTHATIYHSLSPEALQFLFPPAEAPAPQFGFTVRCSAKP